MNVEELIRQLEIVEDKKQEVAIQIIENHGVCNINQIIRIITNFEYKDGILFLTFDHREVNKG